MAYYYLNKMDNPHNQYKYQYLDHMETTIDIRQNYWEFATQLFCINDFKLPPGCLVANLELPYQEIKDISFYLASDQSRAKEAVIYNKKYSHIYESKFGIDIGNNQFFKQDINNTKVNCTLQLEIDPQVIKNAGVSLDQEALDTLITETSEQRWDFNMYYTNTQVVKGSDVVSNINGYQLITGHDCASKSCLVSIENNDYHDNNDAINELVYIESLTPFQILDCKVKFYYWIEDESEAKTIETNLLLDREIVYQQSICLNQHTGYDFINNKVTFNAGGILGFYIPKYSHGYYEVELIMNQSNNLTKYVIRNEFVFNNNINNPHIVFSKIRIETLDGFERIKWNG